MSDWCIGSNDSHGSTNCTFCKPAYCVCQKLVSDNTHESSLGDYLEENQFRNDDYRPFSPTASERPWQPFESEEGREHQEDQLIDHCFLEPVNDEGLTQRRLGKLQLDLSQADGTLTTWEPPYNPVNSQVITKTSAISESHDGYESSSSTIHQQWSHEPNRPASSAWPTNEQIHAQPGVDCRDFVDGISPRIRLIGEPFAIESLRQLTAINVDSSVIVNRQWASADHQLCALFALQISLRTIFVDRPDFHAFFTPRYLRNILRSHDYYTRALQSLGPTPDQQTRDELFAENNLSVNAVFIILQLLGRELDTPLALGICSLERGSLEPTYSAYRLHGPSEDLSVITVWLYNDRFDQDGTGMSHWSGFGADDLAGHDSSIEPSLQLNAGHMGAFEGIQPYQSPLDRSISSHSAPSRNASLSSYPSTETPPTSMSRTSSLQGHDTHSGSMLAPPGISLRHTSSRSSGHSSSDKNKATCPQCGKTVQRTGLSKHMKIHDHDHRHKVGKHLCPHCPKRFQYPKDVRRHLSTHTPSRNWKCGFLDCVFSDIGFTREDHRDRHMATVHFDKGNKEVDPPTYPYPEPPFDE